MNPFVFIVGCPRSGTTLLQRLVDAHPRIAITPESHWIPGLYRKAMRIGRGKPHFTPKLINKLLGRPKFAQWGIQRPQLEALLATGTTFAPDFVSGIYDLYGQARGKTRVGDKTPGYARGIPFLSSLWPHVKFVHLIRDGRDVCLSALHWKRPGKLLLRSRTWASDPVTTVAVWWDWHVRPARAAGRSLSPDRYYEIRYEDLVSQPDEELPRLCAFLEVPYDAAMQRFHEGRMMPASDLDAKHGWLPITSGLRDWRSQMAALYQERFEAAAGMLLDELGYARAVQFSPSELLTHAITVRKVFEQDMSEAAADFCS
jgi:hypothetical protein